MNELNVVLARVHPNTLKAALVAELGDKCPGVSTYGNDRPISIWLEDEATAEDFSTAEMIAAAHDPVFISANKTRIVADGSDTAIVTVYAQNAVNLLIAGVSVPVPIINGLGIAQIVSNDPASIEVTVENPDNRTTDRIIIEAI